MRDVGGERMLSWPPATMILASPLAICCMAERDGAQARAADLIEAPGGLFLRDAGLDGGLAGGVLAFAGAEDLAQDDFVDVGGVDLGALQRGGDGRDAEIMRRSLANAPLNEPTAVRAAPTITISCRHRSFLSCKDPVGF